ncbi:MAG: hypothetical protein HYS06_02325 [Methylocystis sp.]|nr:hypothetical protein [Methylocystis sp.]
MVRSVALYLARFDEGLDNADTRCFEEDVNGALEKAADPISEEIRQKLSEETRAAMQGECAALIEAERAQFVERLNAERSMWSIEQGNRLGENFCKAISDLTANLEATLEKILEPFVVQGVREQMVGGFVAQVRTLLADRKAPVIQLSGPMDLLNAVCARLNSADVATNVTETDEVDVKARLDSTVIETRMQEWMHYLRNGD